MPSGFDIEIERLARDTKSFFEAWSELLFLPLRCLGELAGGGAATHYRSQEFTVPPAAVDRALVPGTLSIGLPRPGYPPEQLPVGAVRVVPSILPAGKTAFHLVVDVRRLAGAPGGTYWGEVTGADPSQPAGQGVAVPVWLVIP
jgi:hypothetical protein